MKKLIVLVAMVFLTVSANAAPSLTCDPQVKYDEATATDGVENYEYTLDGGTTWQNAGIEDMGDGNVRLMFDLEPLDNNVTVNLQIRATNIWGASTPVPFVLTKSPPSDLSG